MNKPLISIIIFLLLFVDSVNAQLWNKEIAVRNKKLPGQTAPYDMVFIPGKGNIPSFYAGVTEETNINYVIYLKWLQGVYVSYPQVVRAALPHVQSDSATGVLLNEPYITQYMLNPAYAYYPVVNLSWKQIQDYLAWKTDRLNEAILIKTGAMTPNISYQTDENNFVTDAYFLGQYDGLPLKMPKPTFQDGLFFTGFRLPTESEWEYLRSFALPVSSGLQKHNINFYRHPFGEGYFTLYWLKWFEKYPSLGGSTWETPPGDLFIENTYHADPKKFFSVSYNFEPKNFRSDSVFKLIEDYPANGYGVINLDGGVREWVLDAYNDSIQHGTWPEIMRNGGFNISNALRMHQDGHAQEKDSLGRMHNARSIGVDGNGFPKYVSIQPIDLRSYYRVVRGGSYKDRGYYRDSLHQDSFAYDVGFRCILPYTGAPVLKEYKVNWDHPMRHPKTLELEKEKSTSQIKYPKKNNPKPSKKKKKIPAVRLPH